MNTNKNKNTDVGDRLKFEGGKWLDEGKRLANGRIEHNAVLLTNDDGMRNFEIKTGDSVSLWNGVDDEDNSNKKKNDKDKDDEESKLIVWKSEWKARVECMWEEPQSDERMFRARWYYKKHDIEKLDPEDFEGPFSRKILLKSLTENDLILSSENDENALDTISGPAIVLFRRPGDKLPPQMPKEAFVCRYSFSVSNDGSKLIAKSYQNGDKNDHRILLPPNPPQDQNKNKGNNTNASTFDNNIRPDTTPSTITADYGKKQTGSESLVIDLTDGNGAVDDNKRSNNKDKNDTGMKNAEMDSKKNNESTQNWTLTRSPPKDGSDKKKNKTLSPTSNVVDEVEELNNLKISDSSNKSVHTVSQSLAFTPVNSNKESSKLSQHQQEKEEQQQPQHKRKSSSSSFSSYASHQRKSVKKSQQGQQITMISNKKKSSKSITDSNSECTPSPLLSSKSRATAKFTNNEKDNEKEYPTDTTATNAAANAAANTANTTTKTSKVTQHRQEEEPEEMEVEEEYDEVEHQRKQLLEQLQSKSKEFSIDIIWLPNISDDEEYILNQIEMELAWLGEESRYCLGYEYFQWDFIYEYASPQLKAELKKMKGNDDYSMDNTNNNNGDRKVEFLIRNDVIMVKERFRAYRRFVRKALRRGFRRDLMRPVIARLRMFYGRHRCPEGHDSDSTSYDVKEDDNEDEKSEDSYNNNDNDNDSNTDTDNEVFPNNRRVTRRSNNNRKSTENKRVTRSSIRNNDQPTTTRKNNLPDFPPADFEKAWKNALRIRQQPKKPKKKR